MSSNDTLFGGTITQPNPKVEDVFSALNINLHLIRSCRLKYLSELAYDSSQNFAQNIFKLVPDTVLPHIEVSLKSIEGIRQLGDKILDSIEEIKWDYESGPNVDEFGEPFPEYTVEEAKADAKSTIESLLKNTETELKHLKDNLLERIEFITVNDTPESDKGITKLKLNLSVDEISALFRGLYEAGLIEITHISLLNKFIAQNFESKQTKEISVKGLKTGYYTITGATTISLLELLKRVGDTIKKVSEK